MPQLLAFQRLLKIPDSGQKIHTVSLMGEYVRAAQDDVQPFCLHNQCIEGHIICAKGSADKTASLVEYSIV